MRALALSLAAILQVGSCLDSPGGLSPHFQAAYKGWQEQGLPSTNGSCYNSGTYSTAGSAEEFKQYCLVEPKFAASCLIYRDNRWEAILAPDQSITPDGEPVIHEALHALHRCTSLYVGYNYYDSYHKNPQIWKALGGENSAQARAEKAFAAGD